MKFISYAVWRVRQAIFHSLSEHHRIFRLPQKLSGQVSKMGNAREKLAAELERQPTTAELAKQTAMTEEERSAGVTAVVFTDGTLFSVVGYRSTSANRKSDGVISWVCRLKTDNR